MQEDEQAIQEAESTLSAKKINAVDYDAVLAALQKRKDALANIERERSRQFYQDAFNLISVIQRSGDERVVSCAVYLRRFAEHVAQQTLDLEKTYGSVKEIVDHIASMSEDA